MFIEQDIEVDYNLESFTAQDLQDLNQSIVDNYGDVSDEEIDIQENIQRDNFYISPSVEIVSAPEKGRYMIAKEFIPEDTVILFEKPYNFTLYEKNNFSYCSNCYKKIGLNVWPCEGCDEVVFCDQKCAIEAMDQYHKYECGFTGMLYQLGVGVKQVFNMFSKFGCFKAQKCEQSVAQKGFDISEYINSDRQRTTPYIEKSEEEKISYFKALTTLEHHMKERGEDENFLLTFIAIEAVILLNYKKALDINIINDFDSFVSITDTFIVNMTRISCNIFGWYK